MLLNSVISGFAKQAFVPMPSGADPAQGQGGDPNAQQGQSSASAGQTPIPPELLQQLQDPNVQQLLQKNNITVQDPVNGVLVDQQGQQLPPETVMQLLQQVQQVMQAEQQKAAPKGKDGAPAPSVQIDVTDLTKLIEGAVTNAVRGVAQKEFATLFKDMSRQVSDLNRQMQQEMRTTTMAAKQGQGQGQMMQQPMMMPPQQSPEIAQIAQQVSQTNAMLRAAMGGGQPQSAGMPPQGAQQPMY
jgi:hypothetical protein